MDKVKIGFVGVGFMGQVAHLRNYAVLPECEVVAVCELREELGRKVAARYGVPRVCTDHVHMLEAEELDGIVAAQPFTRHATLVPDLLRAGVPVFIEKPLAASVQAAERIVEAVEQSGTWLMVGYHKRSDPAVSWAKEEIGRLKASGEIGPMRYVRILMPAGDWIAGGSAGLIRTDEKVPALPADPPAPDMDADTYRAYVEFVNYYIHQINLMRYVLGELYAVTYADPSGVVLAVQSESGVPGVIEMSPYETSVAWQESVLVAFKRGYVRIELPAPLASNRPGTVEVMKDTGDGATPQTISPQLPWVHAMRCQAERFVRAIRGEEPPPCEAAEALEDLRMARDYIRMLRT